MSDYTQITDFSAKDALASGDPEKTATGADVDAELAAIAAAIATKADDSAVVHTTGTETIGGAKTFSDAVALSSTLAVAGAATFSSTDAGASAGPTVTLDRNSASPAASDVIGAIALTGRDSGGGTDTYAQVQGEIVDHTAASEDGKVAIQTKVAWTLATRAYIAQGVVVGSPTDSDKGAGTVNATALYDDGVQVKPGPVLGTPIATTSGTAHDFNSIPSWVTQIDATFVDISTAGSGTIRFQLGTGGTAQATGYFGTVVELLNAAAVNTAALSEAFSLDPSGAAARVRSGSLRATLHNSATNTWTATWSIGTGGNLYTGGGDVSLSGTLDMVRLTNSAGDAFDGGSFNILYS